MVFLFIGLFALMLILAVLLLPICARTELYIRGAGIKLIATVRLLFLIPLRFRFRIEYEPYRGIMIKKLTGKKEKLVKVLGEKNKKRRIKRKYSHAFLRSLRVREIESMGEIGIKGEPALTVFLSGVLGIITETLLEIIIVMFDGEKKTSNFFPCLSRNTFILNFTGIFSLTPAKLLNEVIHCHKEEE
ncbi:MAG: hypothetical protein MR530_05010 [Clostridiales bacterium]|nr:hypothetical protein [Clostridiales bacterium]